MIKAKKDNLIIIGLSDLNLEKLKNDKPIKFNLKELGMPDIDIFIFNGKDEFTMKKMLFEVGAIDPLTTVITDSSADKN